MNISKVINSTEGEPIENNNLNPDSKEIRDLKLGLETICLRDVTAETIDWIWIDRIPRGSLTMLDGDPGTGKSHVTLAIAAALSNGTALPLQPPCAPAKTLIVACEDSLGQSVKPRLQRLNANCDLIFSYDKLFELTSEGIQKLDETIGIHEPDLVIIDPIIAYVGAGLDTNSANKVRAKLAPLNEIAKNRNCGFICVRHLNKRTDGGSFLYRGMGSIDFIAAARSGLTVIKDPEDSDHRILMHIKSNLGPKALSLGFTFVDDLFEWTGVRDIDDEELSSIGQYKKKERTSENTATDFLLNFLKNGPVETTTLFAAAEGAGITIPTLRRAKKGQGVVASKGEGQHGKWFWSTPDRHSHRHTHNVEDDHLTPVNPRRTVPVSTEVPEDTAEIERWSIGLQDDKDDQDIDPKVTDRLMDATGSTDYGT